MAFVVYWRVQKIDAVYEKLETYVKPWWWVILTTLWIIKQICLLPGLRCTKKWNNDECQHATFSCFLSKSSHVAPATPATRKGGRNVQGLGSNANDQKEEDEMNSRSQVQMLEAMEIKRVRTNMHFWRCGCSTATNAPGYRKNARVNYTSVINYWLTCATSPMLTFLDKIEVLI